MRRRHESPLKRVNPSGRVVWVARYTDRFGKRRSAGTFDLRRDAQTAIDAAYDDQMPEARGRKKVGEYAARWTDRRPRSERTNENYRVRLRAVLDVELEGAKLRDWPMGEIRRRHAIELVNEMLVKQGRAQKGAIGILRVLSAMWTDAMDDDIVEANPFYGVKVRANDIRVRKAPRQVRVWSWEEMHEFARLAGTVKTGKVEPSPFDRWRPVYAQSLIRVLSDCGLRLGELLPLRRGDYHDRMLEVRRTMWRGLVQQGTKTDHGESDAGRVAPVAPGLEVLLDGLPRRIDTMLLFPSPLGRMLRENVFYRDVWKPTCVLAGIDPTPHEFRHSWVSRMRAAGVDPKDLAVASGHTEVTATRIYTHALGLSFDAMREAVGS